MEPVIRSALGRCLPLLCAAALAGALVAEDAAAKGVGIDPAPAGVTMPGSPYRYVALNPKLGARMPTIVQRTEQDGGRIDRWWRLRGRYYVPAVAYDLSGGGLSADGRTLLLQRFTTAYPPRRSRFAVLNTAVHLRHPVRPGEDRPAHAVRRIEIPGFYSVHAVSPDGATAYLTRHEPRRSIAFFELRALDLASGRLLPGAVDPTRHAGPMEGLPITRTVSPDGRWAYTLYDGNGKVPFLLGLDTATKELRRVELPQLRYRRSIFLLGMRIERGGRSLVVFSRSPVQGRPPTPPLVAIDTETFAVQDARTAMAAWGRRLLVTLGGLLPPPEEPFLAFARTPRRPGNLLARTGVVGHSSGRPIVLRQFGDPRWSGEVLVFGAGRIQPLTNGCPDPSADIYLLPDLRSEPRLARRVIDALDPEVTIWLGRTADDRAPMRAGLAKALVRIGRWVRED